MEIWCPSATAKEGYMEIIEYNLATDLVPPNSGVYFSCEVDSSIKIVTLFMCVSLFCSQFMEHSDAGLH